MENHAEVAEVEKTLQPAGEVMEQSSQVTMRGYAFREFKQRQIFLGLFVGNSNPTGSGVHSYFPRIERPPLVHLLADPIQSMAKNTSPSMFGQPPIILMQMGP